MTFAGAKVHGANNLWRVSARPDWPGEMKSRGSSDATAARVWTAFSCCVVVLMSLVAHREV